MRINVYSQEITDEVKLVEKVGLDGRTFSAVMLMLHSSSMLHQPPEHVGNDDDRSGVTLWLPRADHRRESLAQTLENMAKLVRSAKPEVGSDWDEDTVDRDTVIKEILSIVPMPREEFFLFNAGLTSLITDLSQKVNWNEAVIASQTTRFLYELLKALEDGSVSVGWFQSIACTEWYQEQEKVKS